MQKCREVEDVRYAKQGTDGGKNNKFESKWIWKENDKKVLFAPLRIKVWRFPPFVFSVISLEFAPETIQEDKVKDNSRFQASDSVKSLEQPSLISLSYYVSPLLCMVGTW